MGTSLSCCEEKKMVYYDLRGAKFNQVNNLKIDCSKRPIEKERFETENSHYMMNSMKE